MRVVYGYDYDGNEKSTAFYIFQTDLYEEEIFMGSSGSGQFGTYHVGTGGTAPGKGQNGMGGSSGELECPVRIEYIRLEDVADSEYYINNCSLPAPGEAVELDRSLYKGRLVVSAASTGEILGNLPTEYNYLINCLISGIGYSGTVISSGTIPVPFVVVTLYA